MSSLSIQNRAICTLGLIRTPRPAVAGTRIVSVCPLGAPQYVDITDDVARVARASGARNGAAVEVLVAGTALRRYLAYGERHPRRTDPELCRAIGELLKTGDLSGLLDRGFRRVGDCLFPAARRRLAVLCDHHADTIYFDTICFEKERHG